jgi:hypothetical protein
MPVAYPTAVETAMWVETNQVRAANGLDSYGYDPLLGYTADQHTQWLFNNDVFQHSTDLVGDISRAGWEWRAGNYYFAEIHGYGSINPSPQGAAEQQINGYMASPNHAPVILNPDLEVMGASYQVGNFQGSDVGASTIHFGMNERDPYLSFVYYDDTNADGDFDAGEGIGGAPVTITNTTTGAVTNLTTWEYGGLSWEADPNSSYTVKVGDEAAFNVALGAQDNFFFLLEDGTATPTPETFNITKRSPSMVITTYDDGDVLNFSAIDANVKQGGDQAFLWRPTQSNHVKGELWMEHVDFDNDGDLDTAFMANDHSNRQYAAVYVMDEVLTPADFTVGVDLFL